MSERSYSERMRVLFRGSFVLLACCGAPGAPELPTPRSAAQAPTAIPRPPTSAQASTSKPNVLRKRSVDGSIVSQGALRPLRLRRSLPSESR